MSVYDRLHFLSDNDNPAFAELLDKAFGGSVAAQMSLCGDYTFGNGVGIDTDKAEYWAAKVREHGIGLSDEERANIPML